MMKIARFSLVCLAASVLVALNTVEAPANGGRRTTCCLPPPPPPVPVVLEVCHPCTGCKYKVEACVPACVAAEAPEVCFRNTLFGYGKTVFEWSNGYTVTVRYPKHGGIRVAQDD